MYQYCYVFVFCMLRRPPRSTRTDTLFPYTTLFRSGVTTLLPQIIADELGADWRTIAVETAPISPLYANTLVVDADSAAFMPRAGVPDFVADVRGWVRRDWAVRHAVMLPANSSSVRMFEGPCRDAAAPARALLVMGGAARWDANWEDCDTQDGRSEEHTSEL